MRPEVEARIGELTAALSLEEEEARARAKALWADKSPRVLEQDGLLARRLRVVDQKPALLGRVKLLFGEDPSRPGHLAPFAARPGSMVRLGGADDAPSGVVVPSTRGKIAAVFDAAALPDEMEDEVDLRLAEDEVTIRRLREGLADALRAKGEQARLIEVLLGARAPAPTPAGEPFDLLDDALNEDQVRAVRHGVLNPDVGLVHGPFGTGKTRVLVEIVRQRVARGERVLCLTASNAAIDHLALELLRADPSLPLARAGHPARAHPDLEAHTVAALTENHERRKLAKALLAEAFELLRNANRRSDRGGTLRRERWQLRSEANGRFADARKLERQAAQDVLDKARVVCGTLTGYAGEVPDHLRFDVLVVDEATQATTPALLLGAIRADRAVLGGDHRQLPPTILSPAAAARGLGQTAFETLMESPDASAYAHMLTVQHRMHEALMRFPSEQFYEGKLRAHASAASRVLLDLSVSAGLITLPDRPLDVVDTAGTGFEEQAEEGGSSRENPGEAELVEKIVRGLMQGGLPAPQIGIITPYAAQVARLHERLWDLVAEGLEIDSVDGFQGREKEAVIFCAVRSNADGQVGFLADARRTNVAITRAKRKLIFVGDSATLSYDPVWEAFFASADAAGALRSAFELSSE